MDEFLHGLTAPDLTPANMGAIRGAMHTPKNQVRGKAAGAPVLVELRNSDLLPRHTLAISLVTLFVLVLVWWGVSRARLVAPLFLPTPDEVWTQAQAIFEEGYANATLWQHLSASLQRIFVAAAYAIVLGVPIGLFMGLSRWAKGIFDPLIEFYWPLPPLSYLPLMIIWFGIGETSKVILLALAMFAPICLSTQAGVRGVPVQRVNAVLSLGATRWQLICSVIVPSALPEILTGTRIALGVGWSTLVAAELIAATRGIGYMILSASQFLATDAVFVGIIVIALWAFVFSSLLKLLERVLVPWKGKM